MQYFEPKPDVAINRILTGIMPAALYDDGFVITPPAAGGVAHVDLKAAGGFALVQTEQGETIKVAGQHDIQVPINTGENLLWLKVNVANGVITKQVDKSAALHAVEVINSPVAPLSSLYLGKVNLTDGALSISADDFNFDGVQRFSFDKFKIKPFKDAEPVLSLYRRHRLKEQTSKSAPSVQGLNDGDWFSVKRFSAEQPVITAYNSDGTTSGANQEKFRRLADGQISTFVTIVKADINERVFVYNKLDNMWEF
ncbi:hypothetical protein MHM93_14695 [Pseudoalteromonas sp. MM17-2]|uniref:hypothetical protein n=1 Tax=Pseudoalteromonas sp. MM17-2 TaxID=2917753 RepID=UPI001EF59A15|nr:hypothetical protein [Pseudoalteromonas sp. MM17-2]MCG7545427.1 hypothetical protein [Pseudoalteromonas sp. MM17-2]